VQANVDQASLTVFAAGEASVTFVDDVVTHTRRSLRPGNGVSLRSGNGDDDWEPTPLPGPPPEGPKRNKKIRTWEPTPLGDIGPSLTLEAPSPDRLEVPPDAFETLESGGTVQVRLYETNAVNLSHLSGLAEAADSSPGRMVVELHGDD
jgi:hypothetical protein